MRGRHHYMEGHDDQGKTIQSPAFAVLLPDATLRSWQYHLTAWAAMGTRFHQHGRNRADRRPPQLRDECYQLPSVHFLKAQFFNGDS